MDKWTIKTIKKTEDLLPSNEFFDPYFNSTIETFDATKVRTPPSTLSNIEQLLLVLPYLFEGKNFVQAISNFDNYGIERLYTFASHFNKVQNIKSGNILVKIQFMKPKHESLQLFNHLDSINKINKFISSLYLTPNPRVNYHQSINVNPNLGTLFLLNRNMIHPLNDYELLQARDFIEFFSECYPRSYIIKSNDIYFEKELLNNFGVRVLSHVYDTLICNVLENTVLFFGGANLSKI
ncbi:hypothetical protein [Bacillus sp. PS06]|uniref:hypothetical protein n=1 Tax=Bacillus sp. PS06 TaxID=2764176 RepID=UPI0017810DE5|nr:hypothetical protein [Bacillus sp. PS06]MBD8070847.1 hypothetical protein [Bacillus sp. PS06]